MNNNLTTLDCIILLKSAYPRQTFGPETVRVYQMTLSEINPELLQAAVLKHISTSKWFPTVAEIRAAVVEIVLQTANQPTALEAWGIVIKEIRRVGHWRRPDLPPAILKAVNDIGGWRQLCMSENNTADRARFVEAYTSRQQRLAHRLQQLPAVTAVEEKLAAQQDNLDPRANAILPPKTTPDDPP
jgi:hypothetical protein